MIGSVAMGSSSGAWPGVGHHWAIRVAEAASFAKPALGGSPTNWTSVGKFFTPGLGVAGAIIEIRNLDTGQVGTFKLLLAELGAGIGVGLSDGNGEWAYFETVHGETLGSFAGDSVRLANLQLGTISAVTRIVLPVEIKHDSLWSRLNGDSVDISGTADSAGLGVAEGVGTLTLQKVVEGPPMQGLGDDLRQRMRDLQDKFYDERATSHPDPPPDDLEQSYPANTSEPDAELLQDSSRGDSAGQGYDPGMVSQRDGPGQAFDAGTMTQGYDAGQGYDPATMSPAYVPVQNYDPATMDSAYDPATMSPAYDPGTTSQADNSGQGYDPATMSQADNSGQGYDPATMSQAYDPATMSQADNSGQDFDAAWTATRR